MEDLLRYYWKQSVWLRGAILALTLVSIFLPMLGIDDKEFLKFTHALVDRWDYVLFLCFDWISKFLPWDAEWSRIERYFIIAWAACLTFSNEIFRENPFRNTTVLLITLAWNIVLFFFISSVAHFEELGWVVNVLALITGLVCAYLFAMGLSLRRKAALAVFYSATFLVVLELLYFAPFLNDYISSATDVIGTFPADTK